MARVRALIGKTLYSQKLELCVCVRLRERVVATKQASGTSVSSPFGKGVNVQRKVS
jgi:hypothetical protein